LLVMDIGPIQKTSAVEACKIRNGTWLPKLTTIVDTETSPEPLLPLSALVCAAMLRLKTWSPPHDDHSLSNQVVESVEFLAIRGPVNPKLVWL
jgi:hypothetical protein